MDKSSDVVRILREVYGITSLEGLRKAINELGYIDVSPFCGKTKEVVKS